MQSHLTLSELQRLVRQSLEERFPLPVWVSAEIADLKVNYSGHCYLELVEKGGENGVPTAQARAVIWRSSYPRLAAQFEAETSQRLAAGIRILAKVAVNYHELYGFSLQINDIDPAYTLGDMERQRQETIAQLQKDGVWEMNHETPLPTTIQRVAVISSANAAGYRDFCKELESSIYRVDCTLFDAFMQGAAAEESIVAALCSIADRQGEFDAVVIIRGGGSTSDLNCFNGYRICSYIAQFPLPVITGIGHDKDTSVADLVAHTALKTPTAVAGWLIERLSQSDAWLDAAAQQLHDAAIGVMRSCELTLTRQQGELVRLSSALTARQSLGLENMMGQLPIAVGDFITRQRRRLEGAEELVLSRSPQRILQLGFAVVRGNGLAVTSVRAVHVGEQLAIEVSDGTFTTEVK
ncbi:MAG: exodeoxyribonuclease VII large subunit [Alistipes sp.]